MTSVAVQKVEDKVAKPLSLFQEIENQFAELQRRAFESYGGRGCELGYELEDWLKVKQEVMAKLRKEDSMREEITLPRKPPTDG